LPDIRQRAIEVDAARRTPLLRHLLASEGWASVLVFVATQYASEHVADKLRRGG
jgi:ATP-dependent RNA helicase RhlE